LREPDLLNNELVAPDEEEEEDKLAGWKKNGCYLLFRRSYHVLLQEGMQFPFSPSSWRLAMGAFH
jgi:hypothetical protein